MANSIQVPNNIEDKTVLKRFLTDLVLGINNNTLLSGNVQEQNAALVQILQSNPNVDFLNTIAQLKELRTDILSYVEDNIETVILQNTKDISVISEQFSTFYEQALAASWYGLSVKAGGAIAGLEVGSLDPDITTPGDENSYFRVIANNFILGRAYEDLTQEEKDYLTNNNLPNFGTVYNASKQPIPALVTSWDNIAGTYKHYFNGVVQFSNINTGHTDSNGNTVINGSQIQTGTVGANVLQPSTGGETVWAGGALISQNFDGEAIGTIGTPTTGFRLSSDASGTFEDPNIFGAYIRGSTVDISTMYSRSPNHPQNLGKVIRFQNNGSIIMPGVGTGFAVNRVCDRNNSAVKLEGWCVAATNYLVGWLQYSVDNGSNWNTFKSKAAAAYGYQEAFYIYFSELFDLSLVTDFNTVIFRIASSQGSSSDVLISIYNN